MFIGYADFYLGLVQEFKKKKKKKKKIEALSQVTGKCRDSKYSRMYFLQALSTWKYVSENTQESAESL